MPTRRDLARSAAVLTAALAGAAPAAAATSDLAAYGQIGQLKAQPGQRDALMAVLAAGTGGMPGCRAYIVAADAADPDALWIAEVWDSKALHDASLSLPAVREALAKGRPLIAGFGTRAELGGVIGAGPGGRCSS